MIADIEKEGEKVAVTESSQSISETSRLEASLVDSDFLNRFEASTPTIVNSSSLSVFGRPLFQKGSFGLGGYMSWEMKGVLPLAIMAKTEVEGGTGQEGLMVGFGQGEEIEEATPLAVEGYERWEDSILVKFNEFMGFLTVGDEPRIIDLMRKMLDNQNKE